MKSLNLLNIIFFNTLYLLNVMKSLPTYGDRMMTRFAGRLTPAASVLEKNKIKKKRIEVE